MFSYLITAKCLNLYKKIFSIILYAKQKGPMCFRIFQAKEAFN